MEFRITSIQGTNRSRRGFTIVEMMIGLGVGGIVLAAVAATGVFASRSFVAMGNYCDLNSAGRNSLSYLSQDIRQASSIVSYSANSFVFTTTNPTNSTAVTTYTYVYDPSSQTFSRIVNTVTNVVLTDCTYFHFDLYQRNPTLTSGGDLVAYSSANPISTIKAIDFSWICSRSILGVTHNSEDVQSSRIVIRK